jgi:hypothetical protein
MIVVKKKGKIDEEDCVSQGKIPFRLQYQDGLCHVEYEEMKNLNVVVGCDLSMSLN